MSPTSPTSSELSAASGRPTSSARAAFRRRVGAVIAVLAVLATGLGAVGALRGPSLRSAELDAAAAVAGPGAVLTFDLTRAAIAPDPSQLAIEPATPATIETDGERIRITFATALAAGADYRVALSDLRPATGVGLAGGVGFEFATPGLGYHLLQRADGDDAVLAGVAPGDPPTAVVADAAVQDFAVLGDEAVLLATEPVRRRTLLEIVDPTGARSQTIALPEDALVERMDVVGHILLLAVSTDDGQPIPLYDDTLFRVDLEAGGAADPVLGLNGQPIAVSQWAVMPGGDAVLLLQRDGSLARYAVAGDDPPALLGQFRAIDGVAPDGASALVEDALGPVTIDLATRETARWEPSPYDGRVPLVGGPIPLGGGRTLARVLLPSEDYTSFDAFVGLDDGTTMRELYRPPEGAAILDLTTSPGGQFAVVELDPEGSATVRDGMSAHQRPVAVRTIVIDVATGEVVADLAGGGLRWDGP